jgi:hypothetical protein
VALPQRYSVFTPNVGWRTELQQLAAQTGFVKLQPVHHSTLAERLRSGERGRQPGMASPDDLSQASPIDLLQEWRIADRIANGLEQALFRASMASLDGVGEAPTDDERDHAERARWLAKDLFQVAMDEVKQKAKERVR